MSVLERIERKIENMSAMLSRIGIDPAVLAQERLGTTFTSAMRTCLACPNGDICRSWLNQTHRPVGRVPEFCPNARTFEQTKGMLEASGALN
jgi:hypothetical protein